MGNELAVRPAGKATRLVLQQHARRTAPLSLQSIVTYAALAILAVQAIYPLYWMLSGSLKTEAAFFTTGGALPTSFQFENYTNAWNIASLGTTLVNSAVVTGMGLIILLMASVPAAYALARLAIPGATAMLVLFLGPMMIPPETTAIPLFLIIDWLGLLDTRLGLSLTYAVSRLPFAIVILRAFFLGLPREVEEAALVDGATKAHMIMRIVIPLALPGIAAVVIFEGMFMWNEFFLALLLLRSPELMTVPLGLVRFFGDFATDWTSLFAALSIVTLPVIVFYIALQRQFVAGLTAGANKG
jgi:raffinose/stachyose/melibiose transport system permease protein